MGRRMADGQPRVLRESSSQFPGIAAHAVLAYPRASTCAVRRMRRSDASPRLEGDDVPEAVSMDVTRVVEGRCSDTR